MLTHLACEHWTDELRRIADEAAARPRLDRQEVDRRPGRLRRMLLERIGGGVAAAAPRETVTIRPAHPGDRASLVLLAQMSERRPPVGPSLVAVVESEIVAAVPLEGGPAVVDICRPTADVLQLLRLRSEQLREAGTSLRAA